MNQNGLYVARKTDSGVQSVHIDEEMLWFARLNRLTGNRIMAARKRSDIKKRNTGRRMKALRSTVKWSGAMFTLAAGLLVSHFMGYIVPFVALPGTAVCLCIAFFKIGLFMGYRQRKEKYHA